MRSLAMRRIAAAAASASRPRGLPTFSSISPRTWSRVTGWSTPSRRSGLSRPRIRVGVGDGGFGAAAAVADRTRTRACALRSDAQHAGGIDRGDGAAAGADRMHVDHRHMDGHGVFQLELARDLRHGVLDQADIGRGAAHVVGDEVRMARGAAGIGCRHHARGRARHHRVHRRQRDELRRRRAAIALHHQDVAGSKPLPISSRRRRVR